MRKQISLILLVSLMILVAIPVWAEDQMFISGKVESGGYGGTMAKVSNVGGTSAILVGGYGGWLINHSLMIGYGGYTLAGDIKAPVLDPLSQNLLYYGFHYGGLVLEYIYQPSSLTHITVNSLVGWGSVNYHLKNSTNESYASNVFVFEPGVNCELNISKFLRADLGVSYRYIPWVELDAT